MVIFFKDSAKPGNLSLGRRGLPDSETVADELIVNKHTDLVTHGALPPRANFR